MLGLGFAAAVAVPPNPLQTLKPDWYFKGSQPTPPYIDGEPNPDLAEFLPPTHCGACHGFYNPDQEPYTRWQHSMMAQSFRDPVFRAAMSIAQQDAAFVGDTCIRCHAPSGWIQANNAPSDGSGLSSQDKEGVTCHTCHRMVDPDYKPGISPSPDIFILADLGDNAPDGLDSNSYVVDTKDRRRGPFDLGPNFTAHRFLESAFHRSSDQCASCHDVSNPAYVRQPNGAYTLGAIGENHETLLKHDMFPEQRTYSEWKHSAFALGEVQMGTNRYGGQTIDPQTQVVSPRTAYSSCQDCHMPTTSGFGCEIFLDPPFRNDLPLHNFNGANSWVLRAVKNLYPDVESHLFFQGEIDNSINRNITMLQSAADLSATVTGSTLTARVTNQTGHKLPTGYPEGRRMWLNVRFLDGNGGVIEERGIYDDGTGAFDATGTKVYETKHGLDTDVATVTGLSPGPSFHLALNNKVFKDNRIPPQGFTNAAYETVGAGVVDATYLDGQYWDDTLYAIPAGAALAEVRLFHQTSSKEYMEFLFNEDVTTPFDRAQPWGQLAYQQWLLLGKSAPVEMELVIVPLSSCPIDFNNDGIVEPGDLDEFITFYFSDVEEERNQCDFNNDGIVEPGDLDEFITAYFEGC
ncbi:MAG: multiheme c-type cytochrome [Phycisphaerales bacterium]